MKLTAICLAMCSFTASAQEPLTANDSGLGAVSATLPKGGWDPITGMPRIDLSKIPIVDAKNQYTTDRVMDLVIDPVTGLPADPNTFMAYQHLDTIGAFREVCAFAGMNQDDPIVYPGKKGASHLHTYFGVFADAWTTSAGILQSPWTTCAGGTLNRTAYWMPAIIDTRNGSPVAPDINNAYYKGNYAFPTFNQYSEFPEGLHVIAGDASNIDPTKAKGRFICYGPNGENPGWKSNLALAYADGTCTGTGQSRLIMEIDFPVCWDGVNLDSPDHKSHMSGLVQDGTPPFAKHCPSTHPIVLPQLSYNITYKIPDPEAVKYWALASDKNPACPGCSSHADYFIGWNREIIKAFTRDCVNGQRDCHNYLLGDNKRRLY